MPSTVIENNYLLRSLGWAIINSFWQIGVLWVFYQITTAIDKKLSAQVKYHLSILLLMTSFIWFILTIQKTYQALAGSNLPTGILPGELSTAGFPTLNYLLPVISAVYLVSLCWYSARFIRNMSANRFLRTQGLTKAPINIRLFTTKTAFHLGIKKKIRVWLSSHVEVPSVTGFLKPVILLPVSIINRLSIAQTEAVLLHELAHIKRNDYLINVIQAMVELILFFNPFAVLLSRVAKKERENCCDDWVMNFQYSQYEYATALLILEEQRSNPQFTFALAATNGRKNLLNRIQRLFNTTPQTNFSALQRIKFVAFCFLLLAGVFLLLPFVPGKRPDNAAFPAFKQKIKKEDVIISPNENTIKNIFAPNTARLSKKKQLAAAPRKTRRQAVQHQVGEYVNALINEELLNPAKDIEPVINRVVQREIREAKYLVKIVEQQSGNRQSNTYYFELHDSSGTAAIKPLVILNKIKTPLTAALVTLKERLHAPKKLKKKRTTS